MKSCLSDPDTLRRMIRVQRKAIERAPRSRKKREVKILEKIKQQLNETERNSTAGSFQGATEA